MSDLIDRGELVSKTEILYQHTESGKIIPWSAVRVCAINNVPTVDAEPVRHGEWIKKHGMMPPEYHGRKSCSICGWFALWGRPGHEELLNYCPNCGARMDGGKNSEEDTDIVPAHGS